jgi:hypothetical protein
LAADAFVVAVLEALVVELPEVDADEELDVALAGRLESAVSAEAVADRPVTLVQEEGAAIVPATKFTAAHLKRSQLGCCLTFSTYLEAHLVQDSIWSILNNSNHSFGAGPGSRDRDTWLAEGTKASLLDARQ